MTYTREQILAMEPGKDLDRLVAEQVLKWDESRFHYDSEIGISERIKHNEFFGEDVWEPFNPSTDIAAALEVWEHERPDDWQMNLHWSDGKYVADIIEQNEVDGYMYLAQVESISAAEAMSKCRLLAVLDL